MAIVVSDIPATLFAYFMVRQGFKPRRLIASYTLFSALTALQMVLWVDTENSGFEMPLLTACAHFGAEATLKTLYLTHPDFFPTLFAVTSLGISNFVCRSLLTIAPIIGEIDYPSPMILFCSLQMVGFLGALWLNDDRSEI